MNRGTIRVLVVDDHTMVRKGLCALLSLPHHNIEVVGEAGDGAQAVTQARDLRPDVILMDVLMPIKSGLEALQEIRAENPDAKVLMLAGTGVRSRVVTALKAGARGYVLKESAPDDLVQAIEAVYAGQVLLPSDLAQQVLFADDDQTPSASQLSERELDVLRCLAQGKPNQEIADMLSISEYTVRSHVRNILGKLHLANRTQLALYARDNGLDGKE